MAKEQPKQFAKYSLGPWPFGENQVQPENNYLFQIADPATLFKDKSIPQLVDAVNVDIDNDGKPKRRAGLTKVVGLNLGLSAVSANGLLLVQDNTSIKLVDIVAGTSTSVVTGLSLAKVQFLHHGDRVYWTNGTDKGVIDEDGVNSNWGLTIPPSPTLAVSSGSLRAGRYLVACTLVDSSGIEHAAPDSSVITLTANQNISVNLSSYDSNAVYVKVYVSRVNGSQLYYTATVAVGSLPATVSNVDLSFEPIRTQHLSPPIPADCLFSYRGMVILGIENGIFPSLGLYTHVYDIANAQNYFPADVVGGAGLDNGFWTATEKGIFWTTGDTPENWNTVQVDTREYAKGSIVLPGYLFPEIKEPDEVAFFLSEHGLMVGDGKGNLTPHTIDRLHIEVKDKTASFAYRKAAELRQLLFTQE